MMFIVLIKISAKFARVLFFTKINSDLNQNGKSYIYCRANFYK